jgi:uncharacterized membrane protein
VNRPDTWFVRLAARREWLARADLALLAVWFAVALLAFRHLPDRIPMHFMPDGSATRWEPATLPRWLLLPLVATAIAASLPLVERLHLALNRHYGIEPVDGVRRAEWRRLRQTFMDLCACFLIVALGALHVGGWMVATGRASAIPAALLVVAFGAIVAVLLLIIPLHRATSRMDASDTVVAEKDDTE